MRDVNKNRSEMSEIQSDLSSGRDVRFPSQDPVSFQKSRIIEGNIQKAEQFQSNITSGLRQSRLAQDSLDDVLDNLLKVKDLAVQGSNDSFGSGERDNMATEVAGLRKNIISSLNIDYGDRYLFAGTNSDVQPFDDSGATITNNSNAKPPKIVAGNGVEIDISITGQEVNSVGGGRELFGILDDVETALQNDNTQNLNNLLGDVDDAVEHITDVTSRLGDNINRMDFMFEQYESSKITQESNVSELVDTNYAEAFSSLQRNQVAYESAMAVHSKMFENTLLNYI